MGARQFDLRDPVRLSARFWYLHDEQQLARPGDIEGIWPDLLLVAEWGIVRRIGIFFLFVARRQRFSMSEARKADLISKMTFDSEPCNSRGSYNVCNIM